MLNTTYIYTLNCPFTNEVMYVGKSCNPEKRLRMHISSSTSGKNAWNIGAVNVWINYLISNGSYPVLNIIEGCCKNTSNYFEAFWIRYFSCLNKDLLNYCHNTNKDKKLSKWFPVRII